VRPTRENGSVAPLKSFTLESRYVRNLPCVRPPAIKQGLAMVALSCPECPVGKTTELPPLGSELRASDRQLAPTEAHAPQMISDEISSIPNASLQNCG
jgi:hypothetical protein